MLINYSKTEVAREMTLSW